jgi:hypothetical protein
MIGGVGAVSISIKFYYGEAEKKDSMELFSCEKGYGGRAPSVRRV